MDTDDCDENDESGESSSSNIYKEDIHRAFDIDIKLPSKVESALNGSQQSIPRPQTVETDTINENKNEPYNVSQSIKHKDLQPVNLRISTKKLLCLIEEIQNKIHSKIWFQSNHQVTKIPLSETAPTSESPSITEIIGARALKKLEYQAKTVNARYIPVEVEESDNCSVYKRLTRKCYCLNQQEYNNFIILFNEDTKYYTTNFGEIVKNIRILKRFLYMGGIYSQHALLFLIEGLSQSTHTEKVDIAQGCAHADICNIFEQHSIVITNISWLCKNENHGNDKIQSLTATLLKKIAQLEEGRRYLKFNSKITNDIKKVLKKRYSKLDFDTVEALHETLNMMHPALVQHVNVTYYCKPVDEGFGSKTVNALIQFRQYMTLQEIFTHLDLLNNLSNCDGGRSELTTLLPVMLNLFQNLLIEYDNSEMNVIITNILNNIVTRNINPPDSPKTVVMANTATEPIHMKTAENQFPLPKRTNARKKNNSKLGIGAMPHKTRQPSQRSVSDWCPLSSINRSKKNITGTRQPVIIVPME